MEGQDLIKEITKCLPIASNEYSGNLDSNNLRTGTGDEQWRYEHNQRYKGQFLQNSLHGRGQYFWTHGEQQTVYEGRFYANDLEGYGRFSYNDTSVFDGLFKSNTRFGPGVFTHPDGSQDVGMWMGKDLMRLCCVVKPEWVPRLAITPTAKIKLMQFKRLVSVSNISRNRAKDILEELEVPDNVMEESDKLYNVHIRNPKSHFFNTTLYDNNYFCKKDCYIEVALTPEEENAYHREEALQKIESEEIVEEQCKNNPFMIDTDNMCVCDDPKQTRIDAITLELERTEEVLTRIRTEIKKAKFRKHLCKSKITQKDDVRKSVGWERIHVIGGSSSTILRSTCEQLSLQENLSFESEDELSDIEEYDLEDVENVDYDTACKLLNAAQSAEKLLLLKKNDLNNKFVYEITTTEKTEIEIYQPPTKKILVTDLLAWNNQETSTEMLKHVFAHRNFEKDMPYCVTHLLTGDRSEFRTAGSYEEDCILFLKVCSNGSVKETTDLLRKHDLNPDLCDAKGNTGIIYAAARDRTRIIRTLVNFGANLDVLNDECFTPLGMCIARYLAVQHDITDWENAFLSTTPVKNEEEEVREWRPHVSLISISNLFQTNIEKPMDNSAPNSSSRQTSRVRLEVSSELFESNMDVIHTNFIGSISDVQNRLFRLRSTPDFQEAYSHKITNDAPQVYILNLQCVKPPPEKNKKEEKSKKVKKDKKGTKEKSPKASKALKTSNKVSMKSDKSTKKSGKKSPEQSKAKELREEETIFEIKPEEVLRNNKLHAIYDTITTLLRYGADPNMCEVPIPTLILAIFTKNLSLIEDLLLSKANPNVTTRDEKLTPLHVLVSLPPSEEIIEILKFLLKFSADPNCRTSVYHWVEQKHELLAQHVLEEEDEGKTPLHLLSMRYDFIFDTNEYLNQMVTILMEHGGKVKVRYLGHTPLSLAIMRKNLKLIKTLLSTKRINPSQLLGEKMGVPLTLFILKRYKDMLPDINTCESIIKLLLEYKANPFNTIEEIGNVIEFMNKEHEEPFKPEKTGKKEKGKTKGKDKSKAGGSKKSDKKGKTNKIGKSIQEQVKGLLISAAKTVLDKHIKGYVVKYLYYFVEEEDYYDDVSANMAKFVTPEEIINIAQILVHSGEIPINKENNYDTMYDLVEFIININTKTYHDMLPPSSFVDIDEMLENFEFKTIPKERGKLNIPEPEAEKHTEKYIVCFHCYQKINRQLFICPECRVIYFCSEVCNKLNNMEKNLIHKCGNLFYNQQKAIHDERLARAAHWKRTSEIRKKLPEIINQEKWLIEAEEDMFEGRRYIKPDPKRRLHLTRPLRSPSTRPYPVKSKTASETVLNTKQMMDSILSLRWHKEGSEFLGWKEMDSRDGDKNKKCRRKGNGYSSDEDEATQKKDRKGRSHQSGFEERDHDKRGFKSKGPFSSDSEGQVCERRGGAGKSGGRGRTFTDSVCSYEGDGGASTGKGRRAVDKYGSRAGAGKGGGRGRTSTRSMDSYERRGGAITGKGRHDTGKDVGRGETSSGKVYSYEGRSEAGNEANKDRRRGGASKGGKRIERLDKDDNGERRGGTGTGGRANAKGEEYGKTVNRGKEGDKRAPRKADQTGATALGLIGAGSWDFEPGGDLSKYPPLPKGGAILELQRRLPRKYQHFLEKISEYWPDFDFSMIFLPYACYSNGQLYYRFLTSRPVFMETYSNI